MFLVRHPVQLALVACALGLLAQSVAGESQDNRLNIYTEMYVESAPHIVQLRDDTGNFLCAGTLVSSEFVLTAAECFDEIDSSDVTIVALASRLKGGLFPRQISKLTVHPNYDEGTGHSNIAVIKLNETIVIRAFESRVDLPPLCTEPIDTSNEILTAGWRHLTESHIVSEHFYGTENEITSMDDCYKAFDASSDYGIFCAKGNNNDDQYCVSDLGGPALYNGQLCGIAQSCKNCDQNEYIVKYTDVYHFLDFIKETMASEATK